MHSLIEQNDRLEITRSRFKCTFDDSWKEEVDEQVSECSSVLKACEGRALDREIEREEIAVYVQKLKNNETGGSDGLVGELLKYGGSGMIDLLQQLFAVVWQEEYVPPQWREGLIIGKVKVSIMVIIVGTAGVGKTCVYCRLMGLEPPDPDKRTSTECAKYPIRVVRIGVMRMDNGKKVDLKQMIAEAVPILCERLKNYGQKEKDIEITSGSGDEAETERVAGVSKPKKNPLKIAIEEVVLELEKLVAQHLSKEQLFETPPHISLEKQAIYLTDSGGQQAFWDLVPTSVHDSSAILFVHHLCDKLEEKPLNELYKEGQRIGLSQRASLTTAEA